MRKLILVFLLYCLGSAAKSQLVISGRVMDQKHLPLAGSNVSIENSYDGSITDSTGFFRFSTSETGPIIIQVSAVGYKIIEQVIDPAFSQNLEFHLKEEISEMKAVVITAGSFEASDRKRATVLNSIDMLTTASANADVTGAVKTLPGVQQVGESEGLFVRGGTASETRTYMDGTLVNNFFYSSVPNIAQRGRFSPWMLKGTVFSAGGYSALYGQALSSALILETLDLPEHSSGNLGISFIGGSLGYQHLAKNKKSSWGASYGYTNLELAFKVLEQVPEYFITPAYHTADGNFRIRTSKTGILKYYGYFSSNKVGVRNPSIDSIGYKDAFKLNNVNSFHNLSWKENLGTNWKFQGGISYSSNTDDIKGSMHNGNNEQVSLGGLEYKNFKLDAKGNYFNAKTVFERRLYALSAFRFGMEYNHAIDDASYKSYNNTVFPNRIRENLVSLFSEGDIYLANELAAKVGFRLEKSALLNRFNFAPRISLAYKTGKESQASFAYGIFYQNPEKKYLPAVNEIGFAKATHYILQYQKISSQQTIRAEIFYKNYEDLLKTTFMNSQERASSNEGSGYAKGFELFYRDRKSIKNFDYWISYSYLDTERDYLNYPARLQPAYASKHTANLVVKKFVGKLKTQFNANYVVASGRPYYNIRFDNTNSKFAIHDKGKTIPFNSLSLSVNFLPNIYKAGAGKYSVFVFSVTNVLGSRQVFGYKYSYDGLRREAIVPPTKTFIYLGAFISFGIDRTQDVINNNL